MVGFALTVAPVVALNPVDGLQVYVDAPLAFNAPLNPLHIINGGTTTIGCGFTVTTDVAVPEHPTETVPVTVYVVEIVGLAVTEAPVVALNPVEGAHVYVVAPVAVNTPLCPLQIVSVFTLITGGGLTVIAEVAVAVHPHEFVTVKV